MDIEFSAGLGWGTAFGLAIALAVALFAQPARNMRDSFRPKPPPDEPAQSVQQTWPFGKKEAA